jgi:DNA repair protein RAD50
MTFIHKLMIQGIRSFSPNESNTLQFYSPLTLIVGPNGTGKTTIIECLRYMTTGSFPPNSKGGAFIYDPKVAQEAEVKAHVRLSFRNSAGQMMTCARTLQLTLRKDKSEMKTLESTLYVQDEYGMLKSAGGRCADIDAEIPRHLGVNPSVLDSIIFCHQEESTWPLGEPAAVKKKLDDIFASTPYSKALDMLKSSRRELLSDSKLKSQELEFLYKMKAKRDEAESKLRSNIAALHKNEARLQHYDERLEECQDILNQIVAEIGNMEEAEAKSRLLTGELEGLREATASFSLARLSEAESNEIIGDRSLAELEEEHEGLRCRVRSAEVELEMMEQEKKAYLESKKELDLLHSTMADKASRYKENRSVRDEVVGRLKEELKAESDFREAAVRIFRNIEKELREKQKEIYDVQRSYFEMRERNRARKEAYEKNLAIVKLYENIEEDLTIDVDGVHSDEATRAEHAVMLRELEEAEAKLRSCQGRLNIAYMAGERKFEVEQMKKRRSILEEHLKGQSCAALATKVSQQRSGITDKRERCRALEMEICRKQAVLQHRGRGLEKLRKSAGILVDRLSEAAKMANRESENVRNHMGRSGDRDVRLQDLELKPLQEMPNLKALKEKLKKLPDVGLSPDDLSPEQLYSKGHLYRMAGSSVAEAEVYSRLLDEGCKDRRCPLCLRGLRNREEETFRSRLNEMVRETANVSWKDADVSEMIKLVDDVNRQRTLRNKLREEVIAMVMELDVDKVSVGKDEAALRKLEASVQKEAESLEKNETMLGHCRELCVIEGELEKDCREEECISDLKKKVDLEREAYETKKKRLEAKQREMDELAVREKIRQRERAEAELEIMGQSELTREMKRIEDDIKERTSRTEEMRDEYAKKKFELERLVEEAERLDARGSELRKELDDINDRLQKSIRGPGRVFDENRYNGLREELMSRKSRVIELSQTIAATRERRKLAELSLKYYRDCRRREEIEHELKGFNIECLEELRGRRGLLEDKRMKTVSHRSLLLGECKQMALATRGLKSELEREYKDVVEKHVECYVETKALELSCLDIDKCIQALDKAIVDFHSSKLEEVNAMLKDLWTSTYKGNDVDWIEIRAESTGAKTYNYKVVLIKNGTELDMRGRCSAGQRMVASLLVRLALADSFAAGCNVLALDEPTTNLDRENVESLAYTIARVISKQKSNRDFQLVVITHDEEFVQLLSREGLEFFYRLKRNDRGDSVIIRHSIYDEGSKVY